MSQRITYRVHWRYSGGTTTYTTYYSLIEAEERQVALANLADVCESWITTITTIEEESPKWRRKSLVEI